jgi:hypothetical protein
MPPINSQAIGLATPFPQIQEWEREAVVEWWRWVETADAIRLFVINPS